MISWRIALKVIQFNQESLGDTVWKLSCSYLQIHNSENTNLFTYFDFSEFGKSWKLLSNITFTKDTELNFKYI